jgi:hypothetical protein
MDKPALIRWANSMGLQGIDTTKYVDETAKIGSLAHYMIECWIKKEECDYSDATPNQIDCAKGCKAKFDAWIEAKGLKHADFVMSEAALVSEKHRFGGTIDIAAVINGKATLIDIKTCKGIYGEHKTQVAGGYGLLLKDCGFPVEQVLILRVGRDESEGFEEITISDTERQLHEERFLICKQLYEINKLIK